MQFEYTPPQTELEKAFGGFFTINAFGPIEPGDDRRFREFLDGSEIPPRVNVYVSSPGGDVEAAINIGRMIKDRWYSTHVGTYTIDHENSEEWIKRRKFTPGQCMSAATLVFLGGRLRYFDQNARFGVHQFSFRNPSPNDLGKSQILSAKIARYVSDMGIGVEFLELASAIDSASIRIISTDELTRLGVVTGGETPVTWSMQSLDKVLYVRGERDNLWGHHKILFGFAKPGGFFVYGLIEAQGREQELMTFPLVELVIGKEENTVVDVSNRCGRVIQGIYANMHTSITQEEAKAIAYSDAFGLRVRGSADADLFLGIGPMSTEGGQQMLQTFYEMFS